MSLGKPGNQRQQARGRADGALQDLPEYLRTLDGILVDGVLCEVGTKEEVDGAFNVKLTDGETISLPANQPVTLCGIYEVQAHELFEEPEVGQAA